MTKFKEKFNFHREIEFDELIYFETINKSQFEKFFTCSEEFKVIRELYEEGKILVEKFASEIFNKLKDFED